MWAAAPQLLTRLCMIVLSQSTAGRSHSTRFSGRLLTALAGRRRVRLYQVAPSSTVSNGTCLGQFSRLHHVHCIANPERLYVLLSVQFAVMKFAGESLYCSFPLPFCQTKAHDSPVPTVGVTNCTRVVIVVPQRLDKWTNFCSPTLTFPNRSSASLAHRTLIEEICTTWSYYFTKWFYVRSEQPPLRFVVKSVRITENFIISPVI